MFVLSNIHQKKIYMHVYTTMESKPGPSTHRRDSLTTWNSWNDTRVSHTPPPLDVSNAGNWTQINPWFFLIAAQATSNSWGHSQSIKICNEQMKNGTHRESKMGSSAHHADALTILAC